MSDDASQRLDELKLLWESDPSSKVYLQLASAYRQEGQIDKAIEVLETSLQHRPRDPRGRVALARCKMETGNFAAAAELLEEVIRQDAAHVEANKQLLDCYLRLGEAEKAEERLGIYKLLNDRDPELDHLEYRLQSLEGGDTAAQPAQDEAATTREVFMESPTPAAAVEPPAVPETPEPAVIESPPTPAPPLVASADDDEAAGEDTAAEDEHRPIPGLPAMKFAVAGSDEETVEPKVEPAVVPAAQESPQPEVAPPSGDDLFDLAPEPAADAGVNAGADADPWGGEDLFDLAPPAADVHEAADELDGLWEQTEIVDIEDEEEDEDETDAPGAAGAEEENFVAAETSEDDAPPSESGTEADVAPVEAEEKATATLGLLYLRQGHLDEAEKIFRRVLQSDADNEAALAGLQQLESQRAAMRQVVASPPEGESSDAEPIESEPQQVTSGLTADVLLGRQALEGGLPDDVTGRKIAVLQQYIQHIRTASRDHVH